MPGCVSVIVSVPSHSITPSPLPPPSTVFVKARKYLQPQGLLVSNCSNDVRPYCLPYLCQHALRDTVASQSFVSLVWDWRPYWLPYLCQHTLLVTVASQSFMYHV